MVKNVLIVPEGAKGGFRLKQDIASYKERRVKADDRYKILIRGLLDVTDKTVSGNIVHPPRVVRHDEPDPYLVVAADKGTAHLSDTANGLSQAYGFWLGDAFASGGSNGYDHKKVGITARGGWVTTRRHFEELGLNPEVDEFTAVGIGDPAGDVFGNGVVYLNQKSMPNNKMKLLGAFNHLHIFLDPDPDAETSYSERRRLFEKVSGWDQYDTSKISSGGGVFERSAKSIPLSPEVQEMLGVLKDELPPEVVIRLLLRLNVDLLWNGGIGTYVKASSETHLDAGDPSNDQLRINAGELRARILGEGGNLGFTQNGRIEYALVGGRLNTDAIDNSGGVDMSDHEVNLKILLNPLVQQGSLSLEDRNSLLESMTEEVAQDVLHNNDIHGRQISLDKLRSEQDALWFSSAIQWVCNQSQVTRAFLRLPTDEELALRQQSGQGLTRPELAVLSAHVKMHIFKQLNAADPAQIPDFNSRVLQYFPNKVQEQFKAEIDTHMLHQSIGMTVLLNQIVGEAGAWLFPSLMDITDANAPDIIKCWLIALDTIGAQPLMEEIKKHCQDINTQYTAWVYMTKPLYSLLTSWLFTGTIPSDDLQKRMRTILERIPALYGSTQKEQHARFCDELQQKDIPNHLASRIAVLRDIQAAFEIAQCMSDTDTVDSAIVTYFSIGESALILPIIRRLETRRASGEWDPAAHSILRSRFYHLQTQLYAAIDLGPEATLGIDRVALRLSRNHLKGLRAEMENILGESTDLASFVVANARAQGQIRRQFSAANKRFGTGVG
ncbi:MAG: NAD-glutamate dehydrogenase domain-containing protein, partial [Myxococcota bacterium]|nr:NAD-glutamate dehydrogenase domain-containing protein [Myxococcota bacterium]